MAAIRILVSIFILCIGISCTRSTTIHRNPEIDAMETRPFEREVNPILETPRLRRIRDLAICPIRQAYPPQRCRPRPVPHHGVPGRRIFNNRDHPRPGKLHGRGGKLHSGHGSKGGPGGHGGAHGPGGHGGGHGHGGAHAHGGHGGRGGHGRGGGHGHSGGHGHGGGHGGHGGGHGGRG